MFRIDRDAYKTFERNFEKLETFETDSKSKGFFALLETVFDDCEAFEPDSTLRENYEISEKQFRDSVKEIILQIQKYL